MARVTVCESCGSQALRLALDLGRQPLAERDDGNRYPLAVLECIQCGLAQLDYAVDRAEVFPGDHPYTTGSTRAMREHFGELAATVAPHLDDGELIVDIGANDGTFLAAVSQLRPRVRVLAIEPTGQARRCRAKGIPVAQAFWSRPVAEDTLLALGQAKVITASNVLAHAGSQHEFMSAVEMLLAPGGMFITENHDWASVAAGLQVDTVYHEHLRYYSPASLSYLLGMHGFTVSRMDMIATHGGSFRAWAVPLPGGLQARADLARDRLCSLMETVCQDGPVYGIGAATRATTLIHWAGLERWVSVVCEVPGSDKIGMVMPGTRIPVADEAKLIADQPPHALLFCWHVAADVVPKLRAAGYEGAFIVPLPEARLYRG